MRLMSEQYRFLRYYIPGFLFVTYLLGLITVNLNKNIFSFFKTVGLDPISFVGIAFTASPAIGYMIYSFYDWVLYNRIGNCDERQTLVLLDEWALKEKLIKKGQKIEKVRKKELIDFAVYSSAKRSSLIISEQLPETLRGFWSHVNARYVSSIFVPLACGLFFVILWGLNIILALNIPFKTSLEDIDIYRNTALILSIAVLSICVGYPARRTVQEAFTLEEYIVRAKEKAVRKYMKLEKKQLAETETD